MKSTKTNSKTISKKSVKATKATAPKMAAPKMTAKKAVASKGSKPSKTKVAKAVSGNGKSPAQKALAAKKAAIAKIDWNNARDAQFAPYSETRTHFQVKRISWGSAYVPFDVTTSDALSAVIEDAKYNLRSLAGSSRSYAACKVAASPVDASELLVKVGDKEPVAIKDMVYYGSPVSVEKILA